MRATRTVISGHITGRPRSIQDVLASVRAENVSFKASRDGISRRRSGAGRSGKWSEITVPMPSNNHIFETLGRFLLPSSIGCPEQESAARSRILRCLRAIGTVISAHFPARPAPLLWRETPSPLTVKLTMWPSSLPKRPGLSADNLQTGLKLRFGWPSKDPEVETSKRFLIKSKNAFLLSSSE